MKRNPNESYDDWLTRVRMFEHGKALQEIASGHPVDLVMEKMSKRIIEKCVYPIIADLSSGKIKLPKKTKSVDK
jgi:hypothetical protein